MRRSDKCERCGMEFDPTLGVADIEMERLRHEEQEDIEKFEFALCEGCADEFDLFLDQGEISL